MILSSFAEARSYRTATMNKIYAGVNMNGLWRGWLKQLPQQNRIVVYKVNRDTFTRRTVVLRLQLYCNPLRKSLRSEFLFVLFFLCVCVCSLRAEYWSVSNVMLFVFIGLCNDALKTHLDFKYFKLFLMNFRPLSTLLVKLGTICVFVISKVLNNYAGLECLILFSVARSPRPSLRASRKRAWHGINTQLSFSINLHLGKISTSEDRGIAIFLETGSAWYM